ncbi:unnamed protein product [Zymoseptoria tritici ST99CH_1E4]|uniref:Cobalamin-independent methionine synthase MetE C-terminal/archaeal domain-containing protein n=1 Tax=Zymoseptoria tritici ST99CH_1E4 TaxID=1276532 RepID=A0A2H1FXU5_ZYMTR|nr:unnamed protein product [Zymoseptoria tritici ST99CH_1E4]
MPPPHRMDHIGSLLRPKHLLNARSSLSSPTNLYTLTADPSLKAAEASAITSIVQEQLSRGILPITSGEFCRHIYYGGFFETLTGMTPSPSLPIPDAFRSDFPTTVGLAAMGQTTRAAVICTAPIEWRQSAYLEEWRLLTASLPKDQWKNAKITIPAPSYQHIQLRPGTAYTASSGYTSDVEYFTALAAAYTSEIQALYDAGCRHIQVDDPHLTYFCSSLFLGGCEKDGVDSDALLDLYLSAHNMFLANRPGKDLHMGMHLCRGNMSGSTHWVSGSYDPIAEKLFNKTGYDTYYLEFDDVERTGGFEPLKFLPQGKNVVLGLVSTKKVEMEEKSELMQKIREAATVVAQGQGVGDEKALKALAISPQCGFSSSSLAGGKNMTEEVMWKKLELVRDVAREVWGDS